MAQYSKEVRDFLRDYEPAPYANLDAEGLAKMKKIIADAEAKVKAAQEEVHGARAVMRTMCPHVDKVVESKYHPGDYYDKAYTDYTVKCADCGDVLFTTDKVHSHYG